ncbi:hypothetical protein [Streptomyces sp. NPDC059278]|uniref:hypothetical protein n=1 Tax=Streptomyces sp. NPDC059278 TaxID=3346801 RepID=UPI0036B24139
MTGRTNPNLERFAVDALIRLEHARDKGGVTHIHAGVRVGTGITQTGPLVNWRYDSSDPETYGHIEIINYLGEHVIKPFIDVMPEDIRPCWDRCKHAPATLPDGQAPALPSKSERVGGRGPHTSITGGCSMNDPNEAYVIADSMEQARSVLSAYQAADDETALGFIQDGKVSVSAPQARVAVQRSRAQGGTPRLFRFHGEQQVAIEEVDADRLPEKTLPREGGVTVLLTNDEFRLFTPAAKAGTLRIRALPDDVLLTVARDGWGTAEFAQLRQYMDTLTEREPPYGEKANPAWIQARALEEALDRRLITPEEFDYRRP